MKIIKFFFTLLFVLGSRAIWSQPEVPMADGLRSEGKIYVVVAIILVIFSGLIIYLISIDRKVSRIEKNFPGKKG